MMRLCLRVGFLAVLVAALVPAAQAKGPGSGQLCGESGCSSLQGYEQLELFWSWWSEPFSQRRAPRPAPFFRLVVRQAAPAPITWTLVYAPRRNAMRISQSRVPPYSTGIGPYWRTIPASVRAGLLRVTRELTPFPAAPNWRTSRCPVTDIRGERPPDPALPSFNYGNARIRVAYFPKTGHLVAGRLPGGGWRATINDDGSIDAKFGWWRAGSGKIRITGRRLDASAPPLRAHVPDGYSAGFQATGLTFPATGCWRVTGRYGRASLPFTMLVTKSPLGP